MDWHKVFNKDILFTALNPSEFMAVCKYRALFYELEREPKENEIKNFLTKKQIEFAKNFMQIPKEFTNNSDKTEKLFIIKTIESVKLEREKDKKEKALLREKNKNVASDSVRIRKGFVKDSEENRYIELENSKKEENKKEKNIQKENFYFLRSSNYLETEPHIISDLVNVFDILWMIWKPSARGDKNKVKQIFESQANNIGINIFKNELEKALHCYMNSEAYEKDFIKNLSAWLLETENWSEQYNDDTKSRVLKPIQPGAVWDQLREHIRKCQERENGQTTKNDTKKPMVFSV